MSPEPFIQLEPMEGGVNYVIGAKQNGLSPRAQTQLWVEQDSFFITKGRLPSRAEFVNSQFQSHQGGLKLPSQQIISWKDRVARVKLLAVDRTRTTKKTWTLEKGNSLSLPKDPLIKEFYSRFR